MNHQTRRKLDQDEYNKMVEKIKIKKEITKKNFNTFTKNNVMAFLSHLVIILLFSVLTLIFEYGYIPGALYKICAALFIIPYLILGYKLNISLNKRTDFLSGLIISIIGFVIWICVLLVGSGKMLANSENINMFWRISQSYINIFYVAFLWGWGVVKNIIYINLVLCFVPSFFIGLGMKFKRLMKAPIEN